MKMIKRMIKLNAAGRDEIKKGAAGKQLPADISLNLSDFKRDTNFFLLIVDRLYDFDA